MNQKHYYYYYYHFYYFVWITIGTRRTFTHSHLSWSSILYLLYPSATIHSILPVQFICLTVFLHNLCSSLLSLLWSTSWSGTLHFILHTKSSPNHCLLFATHAHTNATCFAVVPRLCYLILFSLNSLLGTLSFTLMPHIHLMIWPFSSLPVEVPPHYTSAHGSGWRYYILLLKFLSFFSFRHRISEMVLTTGNLSSSDGGI